VPDRRYHNTRHHLTSATSWHARGRPISIYQCPRGVLVKLLEAPRPAVPHAPRQIPNASSQDNGLTIRDISPDDKPGPGGTFPQAAHDMLCHQLSFVHAGSLAERLGRPPVHTLTG
jgi:hypothetical protein